MATVPKTLLNLFDLSLSEDYLLGIVYITNVNHAAKQFLEINVALSDKMISRSLFLHHIELSTCYPYWFRDRALELKFYRI